MFRSQRFVPSAIAFVVSLVFIGRLLETPVFAQGPAPVIVSPVIRSEVVARQTFTATVNPVRHSVIGSATDGRVLEFYVNDGDRVTAEQPLAQLRTASLEIELAGAQAELVLRQQELAELENGSRPEEIEQARARVAAAQAVNDYAKARFARTQKLFESGQAITQEEYDQVRSSYVNAQQTMIEAMQGMELAVKGPRAERIAQARARVQSQQESVNQIQDRIDKHTVRAPFDGFIAAEHTEKGAWVRQGDPVAEVIQIDPIEIEVFVPESFIRFVRRDQPCNVTLEALPGEQFDGQVVRIVPQANLRSRTFPVKVQVPNREVDDDFLLKAGMLARVSLPIGSRQEALLVPKDALVLGQNTVVYVVDKNKVTPVPVQVGFAEGDYFTVQGPLQPGQKVVIAGNERLRPGADVVITREQPPTF